MLIPRKVKFRKQHSPKRGGMAKGGTSLAFGEFGIQALEGHYVTNRQIEAAPRLGLVSVGGTTPCRQATRSRRHARGAPTRPR